MRGRVASIAVLAALLALAASTLAPPRAPAGARGLIAPARVWTQAFGGSCSA